MKEKAKEGFVLCIIHDFKKVPFSVTKQLL